MKLMGEAVRHLRAAAKLDPAKYSEAAANVAGWEEAERQYKQADLNEKPVLPFPDKSFDVVTCVVSFDYLTKPKQVMAEVARVLRPNGKVILSQSNRCA